MPIVTPDQYAAMIDNAKAQGFALGTALYLSGARVQNRASGSKALALFAHEVAKDYGVTIALHTDHCAVEDLDGWVRPLLADAIERRGRGLDPLFQSHMWNGSAVSLEENLSISRELLNLSVQANTMLEIEIGVVGGEEDGISHEINEELYTTVDDARATVAALGAGERGRYLTALTFGNVHGVYHPDAVHLRPKSWVTFRRRSEPKSARNDPSIWCSMAGQGRFPRKSLRLSRTAS